MSLEELIKAKGNERLDEKMAKEDAHKAESIEIRDNIVSTYGKRVGKALSVMKMIRDNDPELWSKIRREKFFATTQPCKDPKYFYTNGVDHCLGFYPSLDAIGQEAGGACGNVDLRVTETSCVFEMRGPSEDKYNNYWSRDCAKRFPDKFEEFENRFRNFVNKQYGDGAYDL